MSVLQNNYKNGLFYTKTPEKIPLKPYKDFSVIYYIKWSVVAIFSVNPMHSVNPMSVKVMHHCITFGMKARISGNLLQVP